jgi:anti-sigma factor RsiW
MACHEGLRLQAYFDGEVDASVSAQVERHLESCADCAALLGSLKEVRNAVRGHPLYHRASPELRARAARVLDREDRKAWGAGALFGAGRKFWLGASSGAALTAMAAVLAFAVLLPSPSSPLVNDVVNAHLRSLMENHLIDVASSDRHTVKPWFAGHADVSPPTADFPKEDYRLVGGRVDYIDGHRAAVLVYRHGAHTINVFSWAKSGGALPGAVTRNGYHTVCWQESDLAYCAVSDTALNELLGLVRLIQQIPQ